MWIHKLESSGMSKPYYLMVDKVILDIVQFLYVIYDRPTWFSYKVTYQIICTNRYTDTKSFLVPEWVVQVQRWSPRPSNWKSGTSYNHNLQRIFRDDRDLVAHGHDKESLTETSRPGFISTVRHDLAQQTHRLSAWTHFFWVNKKPAFFFFWKFHFARCGLCLCVWQYCVCVKIFKNCRAISCSHSRVSRSSAATTTSAVHTASQIRL